MISSPDYETASSYTICIKSTDQQGKFFEKTITLAVYDIDEIAPTVAIITPLSWAQMQSLSFLVTFTGTDNVST